MPQYSQFGQDVFVYDNFFENKRNGTFVDIGAHDGVTLSNTYMFEKNFGWKGWCFEPNPVVFEKLITNRTCECHEIAIDDYDGIGEFKIVTGYAEMLSGLQNNYNEQHLNRIKHEINQFGGMEETLEVPVCTLKSVLHKDTEIDYLSIDTEGGELKIILDILKTFRPKIISMEANYPSEVALAISSLSKNKYSLVKQMDVDLIFKRDDL